MHRDPGLWRNVWPQARGAPSCVDSHGNDDTQAGRSLSCQEWPDQEAAESLVNSWQGKAAVSVLSPSPDTGPLSTEAPTSVADIYEQMDGQATRGFVPLFLVVSTPGKWFEEPDAGLPGNPCLIPLQSWRGGSERGVPCLKPHSTPGP